MAGAGSWKTAVVVALALLWPVFAVPTQAAERVALVVGNAAYAHAPALANPLHDAADVGAALGRLGFAVTRLENAGYAALRRGLLEFTRAASASEGCGGVLRRPTASRWTGATSWSRWTRGWASDQDVEFEAVPLDLVSRAVARASGLRLVVLDACRENPFAVSMQRAGATRSVGRGLARVEPEGETLVAYSAKEGTVAADGEGRNSPYSEALLRYLEEPGLEVGLMFRKVRDAVLASTGGRQEPFVYGSLSSRGAYLGARPVVSDSPSSTDLLADSQSAADRLAAERLAAERLAREEELLFWESVKDSVEAADLLAYLSRYPGGAYEALARNRLKRLEDASSGSEPSESPDSVAPAQETSSVPAPGPESVESSLGLSRSERRRIQRGLAASGFDPGPADGLFGRGTRGAIGRWQSSRGEPATGYLDAEAAKALLAAAEVEERKRLEREAAAEERQRAALAPEMVRIRGGCFKMGSPAGEKGREHNERRRRVCVEGFSMGRYEVTFEEYDRFVGATGRKRPDDRGWGRGRRPVINVSWRDATAYAWWLSREMGKRYRLPTEAEWEYAARAGSTFAYPWGDELGRNRANCRGAGVGGTVGRRRRWAPLPTTRGACMTLWATCGSGRARCTTTTMAGRKAARPGAAAFE